MFKRIKKKDLKSEKINNLLFYIAFMAFPVIQFLVFYIAVNFNSVLLAFKQYDIASNTVKWVNFENFKQVLQDIVNESSMLSAAKNSLILYLINLFIIMPLSLMFSFYIYKKMKGHNFFRITLFIPSIIASIITVTIFNYVVERVVPMALFELFDIRTGGLLENASTRFGTIIFYNIWVSFGVLMLMYSDSMGGVSPEVVESASLDGISGLKEFWYITLPSIFPTIVTFITVGIAGIFTNQANIFSFYGIWADEKIYTFGYYFYRNTLLSSTTFQKYPYLAAMGLTMTLITVPATLLVKKILTRFGPSED
jgi:ABC-type sugar transport system permease subunit